MSLSTDLPIHSIADQLVDLLCKNQKLLLSAPTGSGKSTCIPGILQKQFSGKIAILQPRRAAAKFLARHVARLHNTKLGDEVGYIIRHDSQVSKDTQIIFMTDGIFLQILKSNPQLKGYSAVILDEFHERHWRMDLALAMVNRLTTQNKELHLLIMSATLDVENLKPMLNCECLSTESRTYPIEFTHRVTDRLQKPWQQAADEAAKLLNSEEGGILIFMPGKYEIIKTVEALRKKVRGVPIMSLYGEMPAHEQDQVIDSPLGKKIIVSTNIAETSLTIAGITAVIDSGIVRSSGFDSTRGINTLYTLPISQANAAQRAGRAGRTAPGRCIRLWSKSEHQRRPEHFDPEILRIDPAELILQTHALAYPEPKDLGLPDCPSDEALASGEKLLHELGLIDTDNHLTPAGQAAATLPVSPRLGALLYFGTQAEYLELSCMYAALISESSILLRSKKKLSELCPPNTAETHSDLDILVSLVKLARQHNFNPDKCTKLGINANSCRAVVKAYEQFLRLCKKIPLRDDCEDLHPHCALLRAFPDRLALRRDQGSLQVSLSSNRRGEIDKLSSVKQSPLLLAANVADIATGTQAKTKLSLLTEISEALLDHTFPGEMKIKKELKWHTQTKRVVNSQAKVFRDLALMEKTVPAEASAESEALMAKMIQEGALKLNKWGEKVLSWITRCRKCAELYPERGITSYDNSDLELIYLEICAGVTAYKEIRDIECLHYVKNLLSWDEQQFIEEAAPEFIILPNDKKMRLRYEVGKPISASVFIQQLFGLESTPLIGPCREPVLLEILAPNHRPIQLTSDLEMFWKKLYPEIKPALARRYHKHHWI